MNVLIIHDRDEITERLIQIVQSAVENSCGIDVAADVFTARDKLRSSIYDLAIIDLTLPIKAGTEDATVRNTELLLDEIFNGGNVHAPGDILGISRDPDTLKLVRTSIGEHIMGCIEEDVAGAWQEAVKARIRYVARSRSARQIVANSNYDVDLVIITALDIEAEPFRELLELRPIPAFRGAKAFNFQSREGRVRRGVLYTVGATGQAPSGSATQALITYFRPRLIIMTGFCGGVEGRVSFGDLLVFRNSFAWDYGKWEEIKENGSIRNVFRARPTPVVAEETGVLSLVRDLVATGYEPNNAAIASVVKASNGIIRNWKVRPTAAASGSAVVTSLDIVEQIRALDEGIWAIEMESYAFYYACRNTPVIRPDFICMKSVADYCNGTKNSALHAPCSTISAAFAFELVTERYDFNPQ